MNYNDIYRDIRDFYHNNMMFYRTKEVNDYLEQFKISNDAVLYYWIGLALADNGLSKYLLNNGYSKCEILTTKLVELDGDKLVDKIKNKLIIPIDDEDREIVGFEVVDYSNMGEYSTATYGVGDIVMFNYSEILERSNSDDYIRKVYLYPSLLPLMCFGNSSRNFCSIAGEVISSEEIEKLKKIADVVVVHLIGEEEYDFATMNSIMKLAKAGFTVIVYGMSNK